MVDVSLPPVWAEEADLGTHTQACLAPEQSLTALWGVRTPAPPALMPSPPQVTSLSIFLPPWSLPTSQPRGHPSPHHPLSHCSAESGPGRVEAWGSGVELRPCSRSLSQNPDTRTDGPTLGRRCSIYSEGQLTPWRRSSSWEGHCFSFTRFSAGCPGGGPIYPGELLEGQKWSWKARASLPLLWYSGVDKGLPPALEGSM